MINLVLTQRDSAAFVRSRKSATFARLPQVVFVVVCPISHALAKMRSVSPADLHGSTLILLGPRDSARILIDEAFGAQCDHLVWDYEVQHGVAAVSLVAPASA